MNVNQQDCEYQLQSLFKTNFIDYDVINVDPIPDWAKTSQVQTISTADCNII